MLAGFLFSLFTATFFDIPLTWQWVVLGMLFALLPDIDFFVEFLQRGTVGGKTLGAHRVLTHVPLLFVIPGIALWYFFGIPLAILFALSITWHFLHDSHAMGYGYRMFYPFSPKFYKFFSDREGDYHYDFKHFFMGWSQDEVRVLHQKYGNDHWIQDHLRHHANTWYRPVVTLLLVSVILYCILLLIRLAL